MKPDAKLEAKPDRLSAFFRAFAFTVVETASGACRGDAVLRAVGTAGIASRLVLSVRPEQANDIHAPILANICVGFGGGLNPLLSALPASVEIALDDDSGLRAVADLLVAEANDSRCGKQTALARLSEVIVLMMLRRTIDAGATAPGLLAGLSHGALHRALAAMHDAPSRAWRIEDLASLAGLSRSRFMTLFREIVGTTPSAYLTAWRLMLAQRALVDGERIKSVATRVGFGSASAFSRAYARQFGRPPVHTRHEAP